MTTGDFLVHLSSIETGTAQNHLLTIVKGDVFITRLQGYKIVYKPQNTVVRMSNLPIKVTIHSQIYKVVYSPDEKVISRLVDSTNIKKGC